MNTYDFWNFTVIYIFSSYPDWISLITLLARVLSCLEETQTTETLVLSIATMILLYVNIQIPEKFLVIVNAISILFAVYYVGKSIILYTREKKKYFMNNMKEIIKKEEKE